MTRKLKKHTALFGLVFTVAVALLSLALTGAAFINPNI